MDNEYILGPDGELYHWGIKGMKWGIRRYQNKDGSLTPRGKKRYAQEEAKLKEREKTIKNQERTKAKLAKLDSKKAELDAREKALAENKKPDADDTPTQKPAQPKTTRDMNDNELQQKVNRLRNEEAYRDLNKKLGYDTPQTEMDAKIADLERQKKYLELQRDINNLTPKKVSRGKAFMTNVWDKAIEPAVMDAGKTLLKQYLTDVGGAAIADIVAKAKADSKIKVDKIERKADAKLKKEAAKAEQKQAKKEAKAAAREEKRETREAAREEKREAREAARAEERKFADERANAIVNKFVDSKHRNENDANIYGTKAYEKKVDHMLAEMDELGWEYWNELNRSGN